eukprot:jgi/Tetstr1/423946/TSEL_014557.t1
MFSEVGRIWLTAARAQLYRAIEVCIEKDPLGKLMEAAKNWGGDLAGGIVFDFPASAPAALKAGFLPYFNIPWGVDEVTGLAASVKTPIM